MLSLGGSVDHICSDLQAPDQNVLLRLIISSNLLLEQPSYVLPLGSISQHPCLFIHINYFYSSLCIDISHYFFILCSKSSTHQSSRVMAATDPSAADCESPSALSIASTNNLCSPTWFGSVGAGAPPPDNQDSRVITPNSDEKFPLSFLPFPTERTSHQWSHYCHSQ